MVTRLVFVEAGALFGAVGGLEGGEEGLGYLLQRLVFTTCAVAEHSAAFGGWGGF